MGESLILINTQFLKVVTDGVQDRINRTLSVFNFLNPQTKLIRLDSGDVVRPLAPVVVKAITAAVAEMGEEASFRGRSPIQGYDFLVEAIVKYNQKSRKLRFGRDEIFVNDGTKSGLASIGEILCRDIRIAVLDPVFQTFIQSNVIEDRAGDVDECNRWSHIIYLECNKENGFMPELPDERPDVIYLSYPNDPTGCVMDRSTLEKWVKYALDNKALILFDATYEWFITDPDVPRSIYEIKGAKRCAIEFRSFSKSAGFTGLNCGYTIIPRDIEGYSYEADKSESLNTLWRRRQEIKNYAPSYIVQRGAEALYTAEGLAGIAENVAYYHENARVLMEGLRSAGFTFWGGVNSPFIWVETPDGDSWAFLDRLLNECNIVCSPGERFGVNGRGYVRLSAFVNQSKAMIASVRLSDMRV